MLDLYFSLELHIILSDITAWSTYVKKKQFLYAWNKIHIWW